jgi:flagella basal body P-ring formation protein FlgA
LSILEVRETQSSWHLYCNSSGMTDQSVKTSTPTAKWLQIVCLALLTWLGVMGMCLAQPKQANSGIAPNAQAGTVPLGSQATMFNQVKVWMSQSQGVKVDDVSIAPLDPRIQVQPCAKPLSVDLPFSSRDTVRVRCADPVWQLYLQVSVPAGSGYISAATGSVGAISASAPPKTVVVPKRLIQRGMVIESDMVEEITPPAGVVLDNSMLQSVRDAVAAESVRDLSAGQPLRVSDIRRAILVKQGQLVTLTVGDKAGFLITVRVEALQDGRMGEQVKLKNTESGRQISGVVTGPSMVKGLQ